MIATVNWQQTGAPLFYEIVNRTTGAVVVARTDIGVTENGTTGVYQVDDAAAVYPNKITWDDGTDYATEDFVPLPAADIDEELLAASIAPLLPPATFSGSVSFDGVVNVDTDEAALAANLAPLMPAPEVTVNPTPVTVDTDEAALAAAVAPLIAAPIVTVNPTPVTVNPTVLDAAERTAIANAVETQIIDDTDTEKVLEAIVNKINAVGVEMDAETISLLAASIGIDIADVITSQFARHDSIRMSQGSGSQIVDTTSVAYEANRVTDGLRGVRGVIVRAFPVTDSVVDWSNIQGRHTTNQNGDWRLYLDPGQYVLSFEKNGQQLKTDDLVVT